MANPDGTHPALLSTNNFLNNSANYAAYGGEQGSGVFVCCGAADNTQIVDNKFTGHLETAINTAGDSSNPSQNLVVADNRSINDSTFAVVTNTSGMVLDHNIITADDNAVPGGHGTGILDFGANTALHILSNTVKAVTVSSTSSGISVSNYAGSSNDTLVSGNTVSGYLNDLKIVSGSTNATATGNKLLNAGSDGIIVQSGVSGAYLARNYVSAAGHASCEDQSTGKGTAGTANTWRFNKATTDSIPLGICVASN